MVSGVTELVTLNRFANQVCCDFREVCPESEGWEISHKPELWPCTAV